MDVDLETQRNPLIAIQMPCSELLMETDGEPSSTDLLPSPKLLEEATGSQVAVESASKSLDQVTSAHTMKEQPWSSRVPTTAHLITASAMAKTILISLLQASTTAHIVIQILAAKLTTSQVLTAHNKHAETG